MNERIRRQIHFANISLAVIAPVLFVGVFLLRNAQPAVMQAFGLAMFFSAIFLKMALSERDRRRRKRERSQ